MSPPRQQKINPIEQSVSSEVTPSARLGLAPMLIHTSVASRSATHPSFIAKHRGAPILHQIIFVEIAHH